MHKSKGYTYTSELSHQKSEVIIFQRGGNIQPSSLSLLPFFSFGEVILWLKSFLTQLLLWVKHVDVSGVLDNDIPFRLSDFQAVHRRLHIRGEKVKKLLLARAPYFYALIKAHYTVFLIGGSTLLFLSLQPIMHMNAKETAPVAVITPPTPTPTPAVELPVTLKIPSLGISAHVENVGYDEYERIAAPSNFSDVAWFMGSKKPGEVGSAFISGHYDTTTGSPAVFYGLATLKLGDTVEVYDGHQTKYVFVVTEISDFPVNNLPVDYIFGPTEKKRLFLVTCKGVFDTTIGMYTHRALIATELQRVERIPTQ